MIANLYVLLVVLEDQSACVKEEEAEPRLGFSCDKNTAPPLGRLEDNNLVCMGLIWEL